MDNFLMGTGDWATGYNDPASSDTGGFSFQSLLNSIGSNFGRWAGQSLFNNQRQSTTPDTSLFTSKTLLWFVGIGAIVLLGVLFFAFRRGK